MFDELPGTAELSAVDDDAALNHAITGWARAEATAAAHRMAAIAELVDRRCDTELARTREHWACDAWDSAAAEIAADLTVGHRAASTLMHQALALRDRMPKVGALLTQGLISLRVATTATWRTVLIDDPTILARVDTDLAALATTFGALSVARLETAIDTAIARHDPDAVRRFRGAKKSCDLGFGNTDDDTGTRSIWGRLTITDAVLVERNVNALAATVCPYDPRTTGERRTSALAVLAVGGNHLPCQCDQHDCPTTGRDPRAAAIVVHVLTDTPTPTAEPDAPARPPTAVIAGGGIVPGPLLTELIALGVTTRPIPAAIQFTAEPSYRPSAALARFVRARDLTCSFPGCDHPAERCDLDHTQPWATGTLTHPGNLTALCRKH